MVEATAPIEGAVLIGHTTAQPQIALGDAVVSLDDLTAVWEGTLEEIYPTRTSDKGIVDAYSYTTRPSYQAVNKSAVQKQLSLYSRAPTANMTLLVF